VGRVSKSKPLNNKKKVLKLVVPVEKNNKEIPNKNRAEEKEPRIKYFNPASVENADFLLEVARTYKINFGFQELSKLRLNRKRLLKKVNQ